MRTRTLLRFVLLIPIASTLLASCSKQGTSNLTTAPTQGPGLVASASSNIVTVPFDSTNFVSGVDNPYFPLPAGKTWTYRTTAKLGNETNTVTVTRDHKTILTVSVVVVHDLVFAEDGSVKEDTFDWYAQDKLGNVWYFGEDTKEYDHGTFLTDEGSWEAGKGNARPGIIMLAHPEVGDFYNQENAPGVVADMAKVIALDETATVPLNTFLNCLKTTEWTPIEPGNRAHKFYAPGVGNVLEVSTRLGGERVELVSFE